jgi:hypothetical protein
VKEDGEEIMADEVEEEQDNEDEEEGQQPKVIRAPKAPTKAEREEHEATHLPFRSWCTHCLRGRGRHINDRLLMQIQMISRCRRYPWTTSS